MGKGFFKEKFETLERISSFISSISDLHKLLEKIMEESKEILNAEVLYFFMMRKKKFFFLKLQQGKRERRLRK